MIKGKDKRISTSILVKWAKIESWMWAHLHKYTHRKYPPLVNSRRVALTAISLRRITINANHPLKLLSYHYSQTNLIVCHLRPQAIYQKYLVLHICRQRFWLFTSKTAVIKGQFTVAQEPENVLIGNISQAC